MTAPDDSDSFYQGIPVFHGFHSLMEPALYKSLPKDWTIAVADIVQSTKAIRENRYKAVNMAGAATIAAVKNALDQVEFPYVFGGDGSSFAVPPHQLARASEAVAATAAWAKDELDLVMRVALVPVEIVRAQGLDVRVARFAASPNVSYAMFSGGGLGWAEAAMKRGEYALSPAPPGSRPDLTGLSCRFAEIPAVRGLILSVVVVAAAGASHEAFRSVIEEVVALVETSPDASSPVPPAGPPLRWSPTSAGAGGAHTQRGDPTIRSTGRGLGAHIHLSPDLAPWDSCGRLRARDLSAASCRELRLSQIRRRAADDAGLHAGARRYDRQAPGGRGIGGSGPLRAPPSGYGVDDLLYTLADPQ